MGTEFVSTNCHQLFHKLSYALSTTLSTELRTLNLCNEMLNCARQRLVMRHI